MGTEELVNRAGSSGRSLAPEGMHVLAADVVDDKYSFFTVRI